LPKKEDIIGMFTGEMSYRIKPLNCGNSREQIPIIVGIYMESVGKTNNDRGIRRI